MDLPDLNEYATTGPHDLSITQKRSQPCLIEWLNGRLRRNLSGRFNGECPRSRSGSERSDEAKILASVPCQCLGCLGGRNPDADKAFARTRFDMRRWYPSTALRREAESRRVTKTTTPRPLFVPRSRLLGSAHPISRLGVRAAMGPGPPLSCCLASAGRCGFPSRSVPACCRDSRLATGPLRSAPLACRGGGALRRRPASAQRAAAPRMSRSAVGSRCTGWLLHRAFR